MHQGITEGVEAGISVLVTSPGQDWYDQHDATRLLACKMHFATDTREMDAAIFGAALCTHTQSKADACLLRLCTFSQLECKYIDFPNIYSL